MVRCGLIPKKLGEKDKQPYAIALKRRGLMAMAGLWETWRSPAGETVRSATIVTCAPNELVAELHDRMPVILPPEVSADLARRGEHRQPGNTEDAVGPVSGRRDGYLAGRQARRQCQEQRTGADPAGRAPLI